MKSKFNNSGVLFLQKTCSVIKNGKVWVNDFNGLVFFSHDASKSCVVLIVYHGKKYFFLNKQKTDKAQRILILDNTLDAVYSNKCL